MIKDIESYRQGFVAGLDIKENCKTVIFGFELNEILDILEQYLKDKVKVPTKQNMTRAEATALVKDKVFGMVDTGQAMKWVDFFIDAGMLEVKEKEEILVIDHIDKAKVIIKRNGKVVYSEE